MMGRACRGPPSALRRAPGVVGVNIGKNAVTLLERSVGDYISCLRTVFTVADYVMVNVSSPNTAGLRALAGCRSSPCRCWRGSWKSRGVLEKKHGRRTSRLLVKLSPDMTEAELRRSGTAAALRAGRRDHRDQHHHRARQRPLTPSGTRDGRAQRGRSPFVKSCAAVRILREAVGPTLPIIGVGGVASAADARLLHQSGADLIQLYTAMRPTRGLAAGARTGGGVLK